MEVALTSAMTALTSAVSSSAELFGQELLENGDLRQLLLRQVGAVLLGEDGGGIGALLGELGEDFQHVGVGQLGELRPGGLGFDDVLLGIAQGAQTHGVFGLHGIHDALGNLLFE